MAGIGFEIRKILKKGDVTSIFKAYAYAGAIGTGPWFIAILFTLLSGFIAALFIPNIEIVRQYQVSVTYIVSMSLILTGSIQLSLTRYMADRIFERDMQRIRPNLYGALLISMGGTFLLSILSVPLLFKGIDLLFQIVFILSLTTLSGLWISNILLSSLKNYKYIFWTFFISYGSLLILAPIFGKIWELNGLISAFFLSNLLLFSLLTGYLIYTYPSEKIIEFDFLRKKRRYPLYMLTGFFYNLGIWMDKFVFWISPHTSYTVIGPLRASVVYDLPVFFAYLTIVFGMATLFFRIEADFYEDYDKYYRAVREGETLERIITLAKNLAKNTKQYIWDILKTQIIASIVIYMLAEELFSALSISYIYIYTFSILLVGTLLLLLFISFLIILFYFDRQKETVYLTLIFLVLNGLLSYISILLGPFFYGYGFTLALLISNIIAFLFLRRFIRRINYETFMFA